MVSSDGGMYQCLAVNEDEESQATAQLVLGKKIFNILLELERKA